MQTNNTRLLLIAVMVSMLPLGTNARQTKTKTKTTTSRSTTVTTTPYWSKSHSYQNDKYVYFPDYYLFYSPSRGYTYWSNGAWSTSSSLPSNMSTADLNAARIQTLNEISVTSYPERSYTTYINQYPAQPVNGVILPAPQVR